MLRGCVGRGALRYWAARSRARRRRLHRVHDFAPNHWGASSHWCSAGYRRQARALGTSRHTSGCWNRSDWAQSYALAGDDDGGLESDDEDVDEKTEKGLLRDETPPNKPCSCFETQAATSWRR